MCLLSAFTSPLPCSSAHIIKNHSGALHVSKCLSAVLSLAPSPKLSSVTHLFWCQMIWKQDGKWRECFPSQDQYAFNLPSLYPWGNVSSHLPGSFFPSTLLPFHSPLPPTPSTSITAWLEFSMSSFWSSYVNIHHNGFCWIAFPTQSPYFFGPEKTRSSLFEPEDRCLSLALLWWATWP